MRIRELSRKSRTMEAVLGIIILFAIVKGCTSKCTSSNFVKPRSQNSEVITLTLSEEELIRTEIAVIRFAFTPTASFTITPEPTAEPTVGIIGIPTLPPFVVPKDVSEYVPPVW